MNVGSAIRREKPRYGPPAPADEVESPLIQQVWSPERSLRHRSEGFSPIDRSDVSTWRRWGIGLSGAVLVALLAWVGLVRLDRPQSSPLLESGSASAVARPFLGRLSSPTELGSDGSAGAEPGLRSVVRGARAAATPPAAPPSELRESALRALLRGDLASGESRLEELAGRTPRDPAAWNDLAVARIERAVEEDRPVELVRALAALERALRLDPESPEILFNRALVLGRLHLRRTARAAWAAYLRVDPSSPWAGGARERLREVEAPPLAELWEEERPRLDEAVANSDLGTVRDLVRRFPHRARVAVEEEELGLWGAAVATGNEEQARRRLAFARVIGLALQETTGDAMVRDAVAVIDGAAAEGPTERLARLAQGHASFGEGLALYRNQEGDAALPRLAAATRLLGEAGSPFAGWSDFYATVSTHYGEPEEALAAFRRLEAGTDAARYPVLAGYRAWMVAQVESNLNRFEAALAAFEVARERLASAGSPPESHGFLHVVFGETYELLGEIDEAWRERLAGLAAAAEGGDRRRLHATLSEASGAAFRIAPEAAPAFVQELLDNDRAWGNQGALVEAHSRAGQVLAALGHQRAALESLERAGDIASGLGRGEQVEHIAMEVALAEGEVLLETDPRAAAAHLTAALDNARSRGFPGFDDRILLARARALRALGDVASAEEDLLAALAVYEGVRGDLESEHLRLSYFEGAQAAFDALIEVQAGDRRAPAAAFGFAERARARLLLDMVEGDGTGVGLPRPLGAPQVAARLPAGTVLVEYALLPDRLLAWTIQRETVEMTSLPLREADLVPAVARLRAAIERREDATAVRAAAADLYDALLGPVLEGVPERAPLVVVPDRLLSQVPFRVLFDRRRGRFLIEERPVAVAPSATLYVTARERATTFAGGRSVLAVGDPAFDRGSHPSLPRLPDAAEEAAEVAGLYPVSDLLRYENATPEALVKAMAGHRVVHVSGHALLDPKTPWSHRLVLAPGGIGGSLTAREIAALHLPDTEVVVLSACRTLSGATGRESFHGLAAAFFAAGPPVVVSSLWEVDDWVTRTLMVRFHRALRDGAAPAAALRQAQIHLLRHEDPGLAHPAAWGAFEAFGGAVLD